MAAAAYALQIDNGVSRRLAFGLVESHRNLAAWTGAIHEHSEHRGKHGPAFATLKQRMDRAAISSVQSR
jgi:hypothetical protein